jgi:hypothetical protein
MEAKWVRAGPNLHVPASCNPQNQALAGHDGGSSHQARANLRHPPRKVRHASQIIFSYPHLAMDFQFRCDVKVHTYRLRNWSSNIDPNILASMLILDLNLYCFPCLLVAFRYRDSVLHIYTMMCIFCLEDWQHDHASSVCFNASRTSYTCFLTLNCGNKVMLPISFCTHVSICLSIIFNTATWFLYFICGFANKKDAWHDILELTFRLMLRKSHICMLRMDCFTTTMICIYFYSCVKELLIFN